MAALSEEDRKLILGKDWKPFVEEVTERRSRSVTLIMLAAAVGLFVVYALGVTVFGTGTVSKVTSSPAAKTATPGIPR